MCVAAWPGAEAGRERERWRRRRGATLLRALIFSMRQDKAG